MNIDYLKKKAKWVRLEVLKKIAKTGKGHIGGTFSCVDLLVALYYGGILRIHRNPKWVSRDRFILSKGHACLAVYAILMDLGVISKKLYDSYGKDGGLGGQLDVKIPGVDFNTGSLGHSIGVGSGMALCAKLNDQHYKVITLVGDSEFFEGSHWEAAIFASDKALDNLIVLIDRNRMTVTDVLEDEGLYFDFGQKIKSFGWNYIEINGHDFNQILDAFSKTNYSGKPFLIMANTIRGKGVSFIENSLDWYTRVPTVEQYRLAKKELAGGD